MAADIIGYYLFIDGKPYWPYGTNEEAEEAVNNYCTEHWLETGEHITPEEVDWNVEPFTEFNEFFPCPFDEDDD